MKDQRYFAIKSLIEAKKLKGLIEVFDIIPLSVVRSDMKANYSTLRKRIHSGNILTVKDILQMADLFEVEPTEILNLAIMNIQKRRS